MKKVASYFITLLFYCFLASCAYHPIEKPENNVSVPDFPKAKLADNLFSVNANNLDGHYNIKIENTEILAKNESGEFKSYEVYDTVWKDVDFRSFDDKSGVLMFGYGGVLCWIDPRIKIDNEGKFETTIEPRFQLFFLTYVGCKLQITGKLADDKLEAKATQTIYMAIDPEKPESVAVYQYTLSGYKRYKLKTTPAKKIEGEYKSITTRFGNTCQFQTFPSGDYFFTIDVTPQKNNHYFIDIEKILSISDIPVDSEGNIDSTLKGVGSIYIIKGNITPEKIKLNIDIAYNFDNGYSCSQTYRMQGVKRFEEADGNDTTIDGVYSVQMPVESMTCQGQPSATEQHLDSLKIDEETATLLLGSREFLAKLDAGNKFTTKISNGSYYEVTHTLKDTTLTPNNISGRLISEYTLPPNGTCNIIYNLSGSKLYKHN
ncbi:hypothetical protein L6259_01590 [Candidatus Parcubacteria bacterium]|nr:hypothetical protein [Patescibacteria group bacterium]MCG2693953.1 hypothetical protein [Candidatus Parcubacteria bacterium]